MRHVRGQYCRNGHKHTLHVDAYIINVCDVSGRVSRYKVFSTAYIYVWRIRADFCFTRIYNVTLKKKARKVGCGPLGLARAIAYDYVLNKLKSICVWRLFVLK